jgi:pimeloyl-ACP methyl ester carboxylesterase
MLSAHQRWAYAGAGVVTLAMLAAGLPSAVATAAEGPDLSRFYHQQIKWGACKGDAMPADLRCGQVTVPLDYAHPEAGTLDLALARYRATGPSRGSVLLNFGGPGVPGIPQLATGGKDFMPLTNGYDVVTFDPRGVGQSSPVSCGGGAAQTSDTAGSTTHDSSPEALLKQVRKDADECAKHSTPVLAHIGTVNASRDLDVMRQALGDKKLNYLGFSYGTRLGAVYASQFPDKTGRMVLDGVDTLTEPLSQSGLVSAEGQQTALEDFLTWCTQDTSCPFGQDPRDARQRVARLVDSLDKNPVPTSFGTWWRPWVLNSSTARGGRSSNGPSPHSSRTATRADCCRRPGASHCPTPRTAGWSTPRRCPRTTSRPRCWRSTARTTPIGPAPRSSPRRSTN